MIEPVLRLLVKSDGIQEISHGNALQKSLSLGKGHSVYVRLYRSLRASEHPQNALAILGLISTLPAAPPQASEAPLLQLTLGRCIHHNSRTITRGAAATDLLGP